MSTNHAMAVGIKDSTQSESGPDMGGTSGRATERAAHHRACG